MIANKITPIKRVLISVSDKTGIVEFSHELARQGVEILSTSGTYRLLTENNILATEVASYTEFPEIMGGRIKTLHPKIHGGILGRRDIDHTIMEKNGIKEIDMVIVNFYPFESTIECPGCDLIKAIENIDIGGLAMARSAAKNYKDVAIVISPMSYKKILSHLKQNGGLTDEQRINLAIKAFEYTSNYDRAVAKFLDKKGEETEELTHIFNIPFKKKESIRYGENPHQNAAFYVEENPKEASISTAKQLQGKVISYNNIVDADTALECVKSFDEPACVVVKHANPCGVATGNSQLEAYNLAFQADPNSAFGGVIAFNQKLNVKTAQAIIRRQFVEIIIAPSINEDAATVISTKKNVRLLECGQWSKNKSTALDYKSVNGGILVQDRDDRTIKMNDLKVVSKCRPTKVELDDLLFAWKVSKFVKSNAIVYAKASQTIGIGAGQMSRFYSAKIASIKASEENLQSEGAVMASDAFFPSKDSIDMAAQIGVTAVIQSGGSIHDKEVIAAADKLGIAMVFTSIRHFRH